MARTDSDWRLPRTLFVVTFITAALYFAQDAFVPLVGAALLSFLLAPLSTRLERRGLKRTPAVVAVTMLALIGVAGLGWVVTKQFVDLAENLPSYKVNVGQKIQSLNGPTAAALTRAAKIVSELGRPDPLPDDKKAAQPHVPVSSAEDSSIQQKTPAEPVPTRVIVEAKELSLLDFLGQLLASMLAPLGKVLIVVILVVFMLIEREELRDRVIRLAGTSHMNVTMQALNDAGDRIGRYLLMQMGINFVFGACVALGLYFIGVPSAFMWGMLATVLRFVPYLGFWIAAAFPFLIALASPGWFQPIATLGLFGTLEIVANNLEPRLYGTSTGLSPVAVVGATLFWAWLWGPVGLILSMPLTVVLVVMGKHVPQLDFLTVVLGDAPVLQPHVRLYQRMLATDSEEAEDLFEEFTKGKTLIEAYDTLALPALILAESDFHLDRIDEIKRKLVHDNMKELVQELGDRRKVEDLQASVANADQSVRTEPSRLASVPVICFPARDEADEIPGIMLAQVLEAAGASMQSVSIDSLAGEMLEMVEQRKIEVICISAVPPSGVRHARYLFKRIRARYPKIPVVIALWSVKLGQEKAKRLMGCSDDDTIVMSAADAAKHVLRLVDICSLQQQEAKKALAHAETAVCA